MNEHVMDDTEFIRNIRQSFAAVGNLHLTVNENPLTGEYIVETHHRGEAETVARFKDAEPALWFAYAHHNQPRLEHVVDSLLRECEELVYERDNLISEFFDG